MKFKEIFTKNIILILLSNFLFFFAYNLLLPTFPLYVAQLGGSEATAGFLGGLYALIAVVLRPYLGYVTNRLGRKFVLFLAAFTATTGPLLYMIDFGFIYLTMARVYHAISLAAFITASQTILADYSSPETRGTVIGIYGISGGISMAVAPALGLNLVDRMGYSTLFLITAFVSSIIILIVFFLKEPRISSMGESLNTIPLKKVLKNRWVIIPSIALFSVTMAQGAAGVFLPLQGEKIGMEIGIFFTVFSVSSMIIQILVGPLSDRFGRKNLALPALLMSAIGLILLSQLDTYLLLILAGILTGAGFATTHITLLALIIDKTDVRERAQAVSVFANSYDLGVSAGAMGLGFIAVYSYSLLWWVVAMFSFMAFFLTLKLLPES